MRVLGMRLHQIGGDLAYLCCIGTAGTHPVLRLAHFGCCNHIHGFGDLARVLQALDLGSNFLNSGHRYFLKGRYLGAACARPTLSMATEANAESPSSIKITTTYGFCTLTTPPH